MYHLRILFTCLCAHVVREDDVLVILPDARKGHPGMNPLPESEDDGKKHGDDDHQDGDDHHELADGPRLVAAAAGPVFDDREGSSEGVGHDSGDDAHCMSMTPHVGAIQFDPLDLRRDSEVQPHLYYKGTDSRRDYAVYFLSGEDVVLDGAPTGRPTISGGRISKPASDHSPGGLTTVPSTAAEEADISWVADVSRIDEEAGFIDPLCLVPGGSAPIGEEPRVLSRFRLTGGLLSSAIVPRSMGHQPLVFKWQSLDGKKEKETYTQALSAAVAYELPIEGEEVSLKLRSFGGEIKTLTFSLAGQPFGYTLQIAVKNMPLESLLEVERDIDPVLPDEVDEHFSMYYALSQHPPAELWVPAKQGARSGAPICPSSHFVERKGWP
jgi:hypothetical protein